MYIVIAAHGHFADSLVASARMVTGYQGEDIFTLNMTPEKDMAQLCAEAAALIERAPDAEYLIFADMFGASPCNSCLASFRYTNYRLITGANLPMLIEALLTKDLMGLEELWNSLVATGQETIRAVFIRPEA